MSWCKSATGVSRWRITTSGAVAVLAIAVTGCGGSGRPSPSQPAGQGAPKGPTGVTALGSESGAQRLAAAKAAGPSKTVDVNLVNDQASLKQWPNACSLLTPAQVKAIIPGDYTPKAIPSMDMVKPTGAGTLTQDDECTWQLGGGSHGSSITVSLTGQNPPAVQSGTLSAGGAKVLHLAGGVDCADNTGNLSCQHQVWDYAVNGQVARPNLSMDTASPALVSQWLTPVAEIVGSELQGH